MKPILVVCPNPSIDTYAWIDGFANGVPNRIKREDRYPGGKGLHVAMALAELEIPVTVAGFWGGETGSWIKKAGSQYYPKMNFIGPNLEDWSRICYTFKSDGDFDDTEILGPGPNITSSQFEQLISEIKSTLNQYSMVALCGSWPKGSPEDGYAQIVALAQKSGLKTYIDCTGIQLKNALAENPFGVHLNRKEITEHFNTDFESSKKMILRHCSEAAITDGSKGLSLFTNEGEFKALAKIEEVISTIGSGDCLVAGILAGHIKALGSQGIAYMGAACGAANCLKEELGMLNKSDVQRLFENQVKKGALK